MSTGVMLLAAGRGTRLAAVSGSLPKPLVEVGGRPLLEWHLASLAASGVREVWINLHHEGARIQDALGDGARFGVALRYSVEETLLGTAGGWRRVVGLAGAGVTRWLVLCGDNLMRFDLSALAGRHAQGGSAAHGTVALFDPLRHRNTGLAGGRARLGADGRVSAFQEGAGVSEGGLVNAGAYMLDAAVLEGLPETASDFGREVLPLLAGEGRLYGHVLERGAFCLGVDTPAALALAESMVASAEVAP